MASHPDSSTTSKTDWSFVADYWRAYGGVRALFCSRYLWAALLLAVMLCPLWTSGGWASMVMDIVPTLVGVSLAAFAIILAYGNDRFRDLLAYGTRAGDSAMEAVGASFVHFLLVQLLALTWAIFVQAWDGAETPRWLLSMVSIDVATACTLAAGMLGTGLLTYSLTTAFAAALQVFALMQMFVVASRAWKAEEAARRASTERTD